MKTAFIGLGAMGAPMARNLHAAGLLAAVQSRTAEKAEALAAELGVTACGSPADTLAQADVIFLCVTADEHVLVGGHAQEDHVGLGQGVGRRTAGRDTEFGGQRLGLFSGAGLHGRKQAGGVKIAGHWRTHGAEADEGGFHASLGLRYLGHR